MKSILLLFTILVTLSAVFAAEGLTDYIVALTKPVTKAKVTKAKADIEKLGDQFQSLSGDYIDFIEEDKTSTIKFQAGLQRH